MRILLAVVLLGAGFVGADARAASSDVLIRMQKEAFVPAAMKVAAGQKVVWTNTDSVPHSVTADDKRFDSGVIAPGQTFNWVAAGSGVIAYHCIFHPSMTATLDVTRSR